MMYLLDVDEMFVCVNSLPVACWTSHVASPVGAFYFSFAKLVQAAFCKYWSLAPDFHGKFQQPSAFSFPEGKGQGQNKMWFSEILLVIPCICALPLASSVLHVKITERFGANKFNKIN